MSDAEPVDELATKLKRTELQHQASSIPGRDIVQVLTEIPVGVESGWHTHPGEMPPGTAHNARDLGPGTGMMLSTYLVDPTQSLATFVHVG